jgi:MFS family permease
MPIAMAGTRTAWIVSTLVTALCAIAIAMAHSGMIVGLLLAVQGIAIVVANVASVSFRQRIVPLAVMARVGTIFRIIAMGCLAVGAGMGGVVASMAGLASPFVLAALLGLLATVVLAMRFHTWSGERIAADPLVKDLIGR